MTKLNEFSLLYGTPVNIWKSKQTFRLPRLPIFYEKRSCEELAYLSQICFPIISVY